MQISLTTSNERRLQSLVNAGKYVDVETALNEILTSQFDWIDWVRIRLAEADADLVAGRYTDYDEDGLRAFFEELKTEPLASESGS